MMTNRLKCTFAPGILLRGVGKRSRAGMHGPDAAAYAGSATAGIRVQWRRRVHHSERPGEHRSLTPLEYSSFRKLLTHPLFPHPSRSRPRGRRAVHFSRLLTRECESSRLLFLGCRERPEGLFRGRNCFFCGKGSAGEWAWRSKTGENTGKNGRATKNAISGGWRRFGD